MTRLLLVFSYGKCLLVFHKTVINKLSYIYICISDKYHEISIKNNTLAQEVAF